MLVEQDPGPPPDPPVPPGVGPDPPPPPPVEVIQRALESLPMTPALPGS